MTFAYHQSHPDTVTPLNEELNWWGLHYDIDFEVVNHTLCGSNFRYGQFEILAELGYETAIEVIASDAPLIPGGPYDHFREDSFITKISEELIPKTTIQALQILPYMELQKVSPRVAEKVAEFAVLNANTERDCQFERDLRLILSEEGLTAKDFLGTKTPEQAIAEYREAHAWFQRREQVQLWLNALPFLRDLHCNSCGVIHISKEAENCCDRCAPFLRNVDEWEARFKSCANCKNFEFHFSPETADDPDMSYFWCPAMIFREANKGSAIRQAWNASDYAATAQLCSSFVCQDIPSCL